MTKEEAISFGSMWLDINDDAKDTNTYQFFFEAIKLFEQSEASTDVLQEIRKEIKAEFNKIPDKDYKLYRLINVDSVFEIIDRHIQIPQEGECT